MTQTSEFDMIMTMSGDLSKHIGKWVALVGEEIIAIGDSGKEVFLKAKEKYPNREPFILKVPKNEIMLL